MKKINFLIFGFCLCFSLSSSGASSFEAKPSVDITQKVWTAHWIAHPTASLYDYGIFHFRKTFELAIVPDSFIINISADNRYRLFVNGKPVCDGPARGDINHWYFETLNIASLLKSGENTLAAVVWNFGENTPGAQMTLMTGLVIQGNSSTESAVNTNSSWKVTQNTAYSPSNENREDVGCTDIIDGSLYPWGWELSTYDDKEWLTARTLKRGQPYGVGTSYSWVLIPRDIPLMEESLLRMTTIRRSEGVTISNDFLKGKSPLIIKPKSKVSFLIDQTYLTNAYPEIILTGGKGGELKISYSEALFEGGKRGAQNKANRNDIEGREVVGFVDKFYPDGGSNRMFRPLWFRTYRYIQVDITTGNEALTINDMYGMFTAYPFKENGSFESDAVYMKNIWEVGWRTARLCAHETYFDCPYYEQLQYIGDTRIQALISLYVDGDDRLMRKAIQVYDWSRSYEGITTSRYPARVPQYIPPFSLYWICMVHDYWMYRSDDEFVKSFLPGIKSTLEWFTDKVDPETGMLGAVPHWNFQDWPKNWPWSNEIPIGGVPPGGHTGGSSIYTLQLAYTLKNAIELFENYGEVALAKQYKTLYNTITQSTMKLCWDNNRQLMWDDIDKTSYSQHACIMGILSDAVPAEKQKDLFERLSTDNSLVQATYYYRFYLFRALKKVGLANKYTSMLQPWQNMLEMGLTTFAENPEPSRSDCHAWSSSPVYDFLATVCGVEPASPGFKTVKITPNLGNLKFAKGKIPHPNGFIEVDFTTIKNGIKGTISLPKSVTGDFFWGNYKLSLSEGKNEISCN